MLPLQVVFLSFLVSSCFQTFSFNGCASAKTGSLTKISLRRWLEIYTSYYVTKDLAIEAEKWWCINLQDEKKLDLRLYVTDWLLGEEDPVTVGLGARLGEINGTLRRKTLLENYYYFYCFRFLPFEVRSP